MERLKAGIVALSAVLGGWLGTLFGHWDSAMTTLIIFMTIDYLTGLIVAGIFHRSTKTGGGALESKVGWKGLRKKGVTLLVVLVAVRLDMMLNMRFATDAVIVGFIINEAISILENAGLMGVKYPPAIRRALELLNRKGEEERGEKDE